MSEQKTTDMSQHFYRASAADLMKVPGSSVAYWASSNTLDLFTHSLLGNTYEIREGLGTRDDDIFLRRFWEISLDKFRSNNGNEKWAKTDKAGQFRKWYGNAEFVMNWEHDGFAIRNHRNPDGSLKSRPQNTQYFFKEAVSWNKVGSGTTSFRWRDSSFAFNDAAPSIFGKNVKSTIALLCSKLFKHLLSLQGGTLNVTTGIIKSLPLLQHEQSLIFAEKAILLSCCDWNSYETSWDFTSLPLLAHDIKQPTISYNYTKLREQWLADTQEMQRLEEENNRIFIEAYGLQDELTPEVPLKEITLICNPHYRYGGDLTEQEREDRLQSDTIAELISYVIGCMMGRYSLNREGLAYAHAGNEGFADLVAEGAYKTFAADDDGILPLTEQEWFSDDVTNRISEFVHTVWGEQHLEENLQFIADSLCLYALKAKKGERALDTIRRYLSNQFYKDHLKTYKRRPIYWLFSSGKHKAFECLVYLHRYHEGTLARMRAEYVIPLSSRINARINRLSEEADAADSTAERNQINRELKTLHNQQAELATFDEQLRHHADMRIPLDLDDGVKENYGKFGNLLDSVKAVTGQAAE